jgi:FAD/FMN-containing dehydrogenase
MTIDPKLNGEFRTDLRARSAYSEGAGIYRIVPSAIARPGSIEDLRALVRWARENGSSLIPRGAGSSVTGSNVGAGVIVDLMGLPQKLEVDGTTRTARTSPNVRWGELAEKAGAIGLRLPPDPSSGPFATLGGMVSTNASGSRSVRYGSMRRWVRSLSLLTTDGEMVSMERGRPVPALSGAIQRFERDAAPRIRAAASLIAARTPRTRKNSSGYALASWLGSGDVLDLIVGSEGTLGIVTEIEWQLDPVPPLRAGLSASLGDLALLNEAVEAILPLNPSALELLDRTFLDLVRSNRGSDAAPASTEAMLLVEFEGDRPDTLRGTVGDAVRRLKNIASDVVTALTPEDEHRVWALRHAASPIIADLPPGRRSLQVIEDACIPVPRMGEYIAAVRRIAGQLDLPIVIFGHAGDGNVHVNVLPEIDQPGWENDVFDLWRQATAEVVRLGGSTSGEHGDGRIRRDALEAVYGREMLELFRSVKNAFDPAGMLNPAVKLPGENEVASPLTALKTGSSAETIPADIASALREIERRGEYQRDRLAIAGPLILDDTRT